MALGPARSQRIVRDLSKAGRADGKAHKPGWELSFEILWCCFDNSYCGQDATTMFREGWRWVQRSTESSKCSLSCLRSFNHFSSLLILLILLSHFTDLYRYFIFLQINQRSFHRCGISRDSQCDLTQLTLESCVNIDNRNIYSLVSLVCLVFYQILTHVLITVTLPFSPSPKPDWGQKYGDGCAHIATAFGRGVQDRPLRHLRRSSGLCFDLEPKAWLAA